MGIEYIFLSLGKKMYKSATAIKLAELEIKLAKLEKLAKEAGILQDMSDWWGGLQLESHPVMHIILNYLERAFPEYKWGMNRTTEDRYGSFYARSDVFSVSFEFQFINQETIYVDYFYITPLNRSIDPYWSKLVLSDKEVGINVPAHKSDIRVSGLEVAKYVERVMTKYTIKRRREKRYP